MSICSTPDLALRTLNCLNVPASDFTVVILTKVRVLPAAAGEGRYFVRVDLPGVTQSSQREWTLYHETTLSTELRTPGDKRDRSRPHVETPVCGQWNTY
jgi:hypothetical protein